MGKENDNLIFIKILFPLLEGLKQLPNFESQLWESIRIKKDDFKELLSLYYKKNQALIEEKINFYNNNPKKPLSPPINSFHKLTNILGNVVIIPAMIIKEIPFPIPLAVT